MKKEKDLYKKKVLDGEQLAIKVVANSLYGVTGANFGWLRSKPIALCITKGGQWMLFYAAKKARELVDNKEFTFYYNNKIVTKLLKYDCIYGDTDSIMVSFGRLSGKNLTLCY